MMVTALLLAWLLFRGWVLPQGFHDVFGNLLHSSLGYFHCYSFWEIPLNVLQVHLCCAARHTTQLNTPVVCPHLILDSVLLEDVDRLQQGKLFNVLWGFKYFSQRDTQLFRCQGSKELIAVQDSLVMALHQH